MILATTIEIYANRKLHKRTVFQGLNISVENRAGSVRSGSSPHWGPWKTKMLYDYGYIRGSKGMDGGGVDCFIGPNQNAKMAYVVHIKKLPDFKAYDEDKVMLGFDSKAAAKEAFLKHYDTPKFYGGMDAIPMAEFKKKVLQTGRSGPHKIEANLGEPEVYDGGMAHIQPIPTYRPPLLKDLDPVPVDGPRETDNKFLDVTKRADAATKAMRNRLTKQHTDQNMKALNTQLVSGFPAGNVGGFG